MEFCMISNINNGNYIQQTNINKVDNIHQVQGVQNVQNNKVDDIKSAIQNGNYQLLPPNVLAKVFAEAELGIPYKVE
jgi:anti-sigma28 factor (negative regulator of flagellin synthesis)